MRLAAGMRRRQRSQLFFVAAVSLVLAVAINLLAGIVFVNVAAKQGGGTFFCPPAWAVDPVEATGVTPSSASASGGQFVTITGKNFDAATTVSVQVGTQSRPATVVGTPRPDKVTVILPDVRDLMGQEERKQALLVVTNSLPSSDIVPFTFYLDPEVSGYKLNTEIRFTRDTQGQIISRTSEYQLILEGKRLNQPLEYLYLGGVTVPLSDLRGSDYSYLMFKIPSVFKEGDEVSLRLKTVYGGIVETPPDVPIRLLPTPDITNISRTQVIVGSELEIIGRGFMVGCQVDLAGGITAITGVGSGVGQVNADGTWMKIQVPPPLDTTTGKKDLKVILPDLNDGVHEGQRVTLKTEIEILPTPGEIAITAVTPNMGTCLGGTLVEVMGRGFQSNMEVWFGDKRAPSVQVVDPPPGAPEGTTVFRVTTPPGPTAGGPVNVEVRDPVFPQVRAVLPNGFTYTRVGEELYVGQISPESGLESGGDLVTVRGRNFIRFRTPDPEDPSIANKKINGVAVRFSDFPLVFSPGIEQLVSEEEAYIPDPYSLDPNPPQVAVTIRRTLSCTFGGNYARIEGISRQEDGTWILTVRTPSVTLIPRQPTAVDVIIATREEVFYRGGALDGQKIDILTRQEKEAADKQFLYLLVPSQPEIKVSDGVPAIYPARGPTAGGTVVTIEGWDFQPDVEVYFGEQQPACRGTVQKVEYQGLDMAKNKVAAVVTVATPARPVRGLVDVIIYNPLDRGRWQQPQAFEYISNPVIRSISPAVGPRQGGVRVVVTGTDFLYGAKVQVGSVEVPASQVQVISDKGELLDEPSDAPGVKLKFNIPPLPSGELKGSRDVVVINPDGGIGVLRGGFTYLEPAEKDLPFIASLSPVEGTIEGGTAFVLTGRNLAGNVLVTFDGEPATGVKTGRGGQEITGKTPPGTVADIPVTVQVINLDTGGVGSKEGAFTYRRIVTKPAITSLSPSYGGAGTLVHIAGADFVKGGPAQDEEGRSILLPSSRVYFGDTVVSTVYNDPDEFASGQASLYVVSDTLIKVRVPDLGEPGEYTVRVVNPDTAEAKAPVTFKFKIPASHPAIQDVTGDGIAISPAQGSVQGGTVVYLEGLDFRDGVQVYLGRFAATVLDLQVVGKDETSGLWKTILAFRVPAVPAAEKGAQDVVVVNPDGGSAVLKDGFLLVVPASEPRITAVVPSKGSAAGGEEIVIQGKDFRSRMDTASGKVEWPLVLIGSKRATVISFRSQPQGEELTVITPAAAAAGPQDVTVINPDGGTAVLPRGFTYVQSKLTVTGLLPAQASINGGTVVLAQGSGFVAPSFRTFLDAQGNAVSLSLPGTRVYMETDVSGSRQEVELTEVKVLSPTLLRLTTVAQGDVGKRALRFVNPDNGQATAQIEIVAPVGYPRIDRIEPTAGPLEGGTLVAVKGAGFRPQVQVYLGTHRAEVVSVATDGAQVVIRTPAGSQEDLGRKLDVIAINQEDGGSCALREAWEYKLPQSHPVIKSVEPRKGSTRGGELVVITGDNFRSNAQVFFGLKPATEVVVTGFTTITCRTPAQEAGTYDVTVRHPAPDYGEATLRQAFTYEETVPLPPGDFTAEVVGERAIRLSWSARPNALRYELYARKSSSDEYKFLATTTDTEYYLSQLEEDTRYYFRLRTVGEKGVSEFASASVWVGDLEYQEEAARVERGSTTFEMVGDTLVVYLGSEAVGSSSQYDLREEKYRSSRRLLVCLPLEAARYSGGRVVVRTWSYALEFSPAALYTAEVKEAEREVGEGWIKLLVSPAAEDKLDEASRRLSKGQKLLGSAELAASVQVDQRSRAIGNFAGRVNVTFGFRSLTAFYPQAVVLPSYQLTVRGYNPASRQWEALGSGIDLWNLTATAPASRSGIYGVVAETTS